MQVKIKEFFVIPKETYKEIFKLIENFMTSYEIYVFRSVPGFEFIDTYELANFINELKQKLKQPIKIKKENL